MRHTARTVAPRSISRRSVGAAHVRNGGGNHYSHRRHHWHGTWWAYGIGTCWQFDPVYGEYNWVCGDDDE